MADVIVKGMEMPKACGCCCFCTMGSDGDECAINCAIVTEYQKCPKDCPLRSAPEWISLVLSKYDENKEKSWIRDPVAYTLYEVWKIMDSKVSYGVSERGDGE